MSQPLAKSDYKRLVPSLILDHALAVLGSLLVIGFLGAWSNWFMMLICNILSCAMLLVFPYHECWQAGSYDYNYQKMGKGEIRMKRGIIAGLLACIPSLLIALFAMICAITGWMPGTLFDQNLAEFLYRGWFLPVSFFFPLLARSSAWYLLPVVLMPISATIGYVLGSKQIFLRDIFVYQRDKTK
mgnify:CR=1 FL=1